MSHVDVKRHATAERYCRFVELASREYTAKYDELMADPALAAWCEENTTQCPSCLQLVNRSTGCNHMVCACGESFCYRCGGHYPRCACTGLEDEEDEEDEGARLRRLELDADFDAEWRVGQRPTLLNRINFGSNPAHQALLLSLCERRVDVADGVAYRRAGFIDHYGSYAGMRRWALAGVRVKTDGEYRRLFHTVAFPGHHEQWFLELFGHPQIA